MKRDFYDEVRREISDEQKGEFNIETIVMYIGMLLFLALVIGGFYGLSEWTGRDNAALVLFAVCGIVLFFGLLYAPFAIYYRLTRGYWPNNHPSRPVD